MEQLNGGEGGIRTPDSLATMSDFESGAFNRALPPLRSVRLLFLSRAFSPAGNRTAALLRAPLIPGHSKFTGKHSVGAMPGIRDCSAAAALSPGTRLGGRVIGWAPPPQTSGEPSHRSAASPCPGHQDPSRDSLGKYFISLTHLFWLSYSSCVRRRGETSGAEPALALLEITALKSTRRTGSDGLAQTGKGGGIPVPRWVHTSSLDTNRPHRVQDKSRRNPSTAMTE